MEKKKLKVNCATCDMRNISEKILETYEEITVNAAFIVSSSAANNRIAGYPVQMNAACVFNVSETVELKTVNGKMVVKGGEIDHPSALLVNGCLEFEEGAEESLAKIEYILVNGTLVYPSSLKNSMPPMQVNGGTEVYPSGAIRMKEKGIIDSMFLLRAKKADYYAKHCVLMLDEKLDIASLVQKGIHFLTPKAYIATSLLRDALVLFDDSTEITELPDGCSLVEGDAELTDRLVRRHGSRLFVTGGLLVHKEGLEALKSLEYIRVLGNTKVSAVRLLEMLEQMDFCGSDPRLVKEKLISDKESITITRKLLERNTGGITVSDCGIVTIDEEVTPEEIENLLQFEECGMIECNAIQKDAVEMVSRDVGRIDDKTEDGKDPLDSLQNLLTRTSDPDTKVINAAEYTF